MPLSTGFGNYTNILLNCMIVKGRYHIYFRHSSFQLYSFTLGIEFILTTPKIFLPISERVLQNFEIILSYGLSRLVPSLEMEHP